MEFHSAYPSQRPLDCITYNHTHFINRRVIIPHFHSCKLAYYVGYLQGDGCLESSLKRYSFTDEHLSHIALLNDFTYDLFNISGNVRERFPSLSKKAVYTLEVGSVDVHRFLRTAFGIPVGVKKDLHIPSALLSDNTLLMWYLRGLFDADGTLPKDSKTVKVPFIDVTFKDKEFIEEIRNALGRFGVVTLNPYRRLAKSPHSEYISETWELRIRKREDMIRFIKEIGFFLQEKAERAVSLLNRLKAPVAQPGY